MKRKVMPTVEKRKHSALSSVSDIESNTSLISSTSTPDKTSVHKSEKKSKSQRKKEAKKLKKAKLKLKETEDSETDTQSTSDIKNADDTDIMAKKSIVEEELKKINEKLNHVVTKDDHTFLKKLVKEVFVEIKDSLFASFKKQIEVIESDLHDKALENENLKAEIESMKIDLKIKSEVINQLERKNEIDKLKNQEVINDHEQYSRRNNIRVTNLPDDNARESSEETASKVINLLNKTLNITVTDQDIDIAHRIGQYKTNGKQRPVIVKFVRRQVKSEVMSQRKHLKGTNIFVNEDLTKINNEILACTRKKQPDEIERSWTSNGRILIKWRANSSIETVKFADYQKWLELPWP